MGPIGSLQLDAASLDAAPRLVLTVRLFARAHGLLLEEFAGLGRRHRAARAAQLMLLGLLYERANLRPVPAVTTIASPSAPPGTSDVDCGLAPEADAFLSAILRASEDSASDADRGISVTPARSSIGQVRSEAHAKRATKTCESDQAARE